jgi:hypothetical protein
VDFAETASNHGKIVIISALSGTFERKPFKDVLDLIPKCEKIKQLTAICKICQGVACFSLRTVSDNRTELIGGGDMYMPVCRECFNFKMNEQTVAQQNKVEAVKFQEDEDELLMLSASTKSPFTPGQADLSSNEKKEGSKLESSPL